MKEPKEGFVPLTTATKRLGVTIATVSFYIKHNSIPSYWKYRIYFAKDKMYCIWLHHKEKDGITKSLDLLSAYRIEREETRRLFERLFP